MFIFQASAKMMNWSTFAMFHRCLRPTDRAMLMARVD